MRRLPSTLLISAILAAGLAAAATAFFVLPGLLVDDARFAGAATDVAIEQKRLDARHDVRVAGVQFLGALALIAGGALTWRTVALTREGQITDRLAKAVEQLAQTDKASVRVGAIYALGRVARDSRVDHAEVLALLGEHLRAIAPSVPGDDDRLDDTPRDHVDPDVGAVARVLRSRRARWDPVGPRLDFSRIDFRRAPLRGVRLRGADVRRSNFRDADLADADLSGALMTRASLYGALLQHSRLDGTQLGGADLRFAHGEGVVMRGADLLEVRWKDTDLTGADLRGAERSEGMDRALVKSDDDTRWPDD